MRPLAAVERFFEQLFERPTARLFRPRLQPIQLQRRIERAMENERMSAADRILVPNRFRVLLHPEDLETFGELTETLAADLADGALAFARRHRYAVIDRPRVDLVSDPGVGRGEIRVAARFADKPRSAPPARAGEVAAPVAVDGNEALAGDAPPTAANGGDAGPDAPFDPSDPACMSRTMVFTAPKVDAPVARLGELRPNGTE